MNKFFTDLFIYMGCIGCGIILGNAIGFIFVRFF